MHCPWIQRINHTTRQARGPWRKETDREELGIVDLEARKIGHYNSENKQSHWGSLRGPRAGVGSDVATREIGAIEERGLEEGDCKVLGPQPRLPPQAHPHPLPQLTSNVGHREAPAGGATVRVQHNQELVVA